MTELEQTIFETIESLLSEYALIRTNETEGLRKRFNAERRGVDNLRLNLLHSLRKKGCSNELVVKLEKLK